MCIVSDWGLGLRKELQKPTLVLCPFKKPLVVSVLKIIYLLKYSGGMQGSRFCMGNQVPAPGRKREDRPAGQLGGVTSWWPGPVIAVFVRGLHSLGLCELLPQSFLLICPGDQEME